MSVLSTHVEKVLQPSVRDAADNYPMLEELIKAKVENAGKLLFTTDATHLYDQFLANLPQAARQHYNCNHCRTFVDRYGGLVEIVPENGYEALPVLWGPRSCVSTTFDAALQAVYHSVQGAKVTGVFLTGDAEWGMAFNEPTAPSPYAGRRWSHLHGTYPHVFGDRKGTTAGQKMAEFSQDMGVLCRGLDEYSLDHVKEAVRVLESDHLEGSEKALALGKWFLDLREAWAETRGPAKRNQVWLAVATAPPGWAHVKNTMIGTLLDDIKCGMMDFAEVQKRWNAKMHPLKYQRPTALKAGHLEVAEKLLEKLGATKSLERRFAKLEEVSQYAVWMPSLTSKANKPAGGVFDHLKPKVGGPGPVKPLVLPPKTMTWSMFRTTVLPVTTKIEISIPMAGPFTGLTTAVHADAPPLFQWDGLPIVRAEEGVESSIVMRNPVAWYVYPNGSGARQWGLMPGAYMEVSAVLPLPPHFQTDKLTHWAERAIFVLPTAKDSYQSGNGIFGPCLRSEYHDAKNAIEAYSRTAEIFGKEEGNCNGLGYEDGFDRSGGWGCRLRVTDFSGNVSEYTLDRWE